MGWGPLALHELEIAPHTRPSRPIVGIRAREIDTHLGTALTDAELAGVRGE